MDGEDFKERLIKNVGFNVLKTLLNKIGGLIFVILVARLLLPDLFGLYSLALSIIVLFATFTDLGLSTSLTRFMSYSIARKDLSKAKQYFRFLLKVKLIFLIVASLLLLFLIWPISNYLYNKPELFYPLFAALFYMFISQLEAFFENFFYINKDVKYGLLTESILQIFKIGFTLLSVYLLKDNLKVAGIFGGLAITYLFMLVISYYFTYKKYPYLFGSVDKYDINKKNTLKFLGFMTIATVSLTLFLSVDTLILGGFVSFAYIGIYKAAFSLVSSLAVLLNIVLVLFPLFAELDKRRLNILVENSVKYLLIFMVPLFFGIVILGGKLIVFFLGVDYALSVYPLYALAPLMLIAPLIAVYHNLLQARGFAKTSAKIIIYSLIVNIILTILFSLLFVQYSGLEVIIAVAAAVTFSQLVLLILAIYYSTKDIGIRFSKYTSYSVIKPIIASVLMSVVVLFFVNYFHNKFIYFLGVVLGAVVYFLILFLIKGISISDINNLKLMVKSNKPNK